MPGGTLSLIGNLSMAQAIYVSITPAASVTAASSTTSTYTIPGLVVGDGIVFCPQGALTTPLSADAAWVSAANTLSISWTNASAGTSSGSPSATNCLLIILRPERVAFGLSQLPNGIY